MVLIKILSSCFVVLAFVVFTFVWGAVQALAQETTAVQATNSEPIYLDEPDSDPPARVSRRQILKESYEDKSPRTEREVARLSDDKVVNDGKFTEFYRDGQKYAEGTYKMGIFDGKWQYWFPNGQLCKQVSFKNGKPDGQWEVFDKEGKRTSQKSYLNGNRHGKWVNYHDNGETPKFELNYDQGVPVGDRFEIVKPLFADLHRQRTRKPLDRFDVGVALRLGRAFGDR